MQFQVSFRPTVPLITVLRTSVSRLCEGVLNDADATARLALTTHELMENTLRHSIDGEATLRIDVEEVTRRVTIETRNRASQAKIAELKQQADEMGACDAASYFLTLMGRCAESDEDGGLGLARIRAEAEMNISVWTDGDSVSVIASCQLGGAA